MNSLKKQPRIAAALYFLNGLTALQVLNAAELDAGASALLEQAIVYAQKASDLNPESQAFRDRLRTSRAELASTLKAHESDEEQDMPK